MSDEFEGRVAVDRRGGGVRVYVELFATAAIELQEGERVAIRRVADDRYTITEAGKAYLEGKK